MKHEGQSYCEDDRTKHSSTMQQHRGNNPSASSAENGNPWLTVDRTRPDRKEARGRGEGRGSGRGLDQGRGGSGRARGTGRGRGGRGGRGSAGGGQEGNGRGRAHEHGGGQGRGNGRGRKGGQGRGTFVDCQSCKNVIQLADLAHKNLDSMSNGAVAAFWSTLPRVLHNQNGQVDPELENKVEDIIDATCRRMGRFQCRDLAQTALGLAKTIKQVTNGNQQHRRGSLQVSSQVLLCQCLMALLRDSYPTSSTHMGW